jgi:hypothetical protein
VKIVDGFIIREIAGDYLVIPTGKRAMEYPGLITMNEVGRFLWEQLQSDIREDELLARLQEEYEVDEETAGEDMKAFLDSLREQGILEEE